MYPSRLHGKPRNLGSAASAAEQAAKSGRNYNKRPVPPPAPPPITKTIFDTPESQAYARIEREMAEKHKHEELMRNPTREFVLKEFSRTPPGSNASEWANLIDQFKRNVPGAPTPQEMVEEYHMRSDPAYRGMMQNPSFNEFMEAASEHMDKALPVIGGGLGSLIGGPVGGVIGGSLGGAGKGLTQIENANLQQLLPEITRGAGTGALIGAGLSGVGHLAEIPMLQSGALALPSASTSAVAQEVPAHEALGNWIAQREASSRAAQSLPSATTSTLPPVVEAVPSSVGRGVTDVIGARDPGQQALANMVIQRQAQSSAGRAALNALPTVAASAAPASGGILSNLGNGIRSGLGRAINNIVSNPIDAALLAASIGGNLLREETPGRARPMPRFIQERFENTFPSHKESKERQVKPLIIHHKPAPRGYRPGHDPEHFYFSYDPREEIDYYAKGGYVHGDSGGADDDYQTQIPEGSFIMNATDTSLFGDGNSEAGKKKLLEFEREVHRKSKGGKINPSKKRNMVDVKLSSGEYEISPETVDKLGRGDNKKGSHVLENMRKNMRKHKGLKKILPKKSPLHISSYIRGI